MPHINMFIVSLAEDTVFSPEKKADEELHSST